MICPEESEYVD
jgi:DNA replication licensing factor MCM5